MTTPKVIPHAGITAHPNTHTTTSGLDTRANRSNAAADNAMILARVVAVGALPPDQRDTVIASLLSKP